MRRIVRLGIALAALLAAVALVACGGAGRLTPQLHPGKSTPAPHHKPSVVDIYSSLPTRGPLAVEGQAMSRGIDLALSQAHGLRSYKVSYIALSDSATRSESGVVKAAANAHRAATDPRAILYIGDLGSAESAASIPILNLADIPQISPGSTYVGLTQALARVTRVGEPGIYYPSGRRTFLRLVPPDTVQAAAQLTALQDRCTHLAIAYDSSLGGRSLAKLLSEDAKGYGITVVYSAKIASNGSDYGTFIQEIRSRLAGCVAFAGDVSAANAAARLADQVHAVLPSATIIGSDGVCRAGFTNPKDGGVSAVTAPYVLCTQPIQKLAAYADAGSFIKSYRQRYGPARPSPWAMYGYVAAVFGLDAVSDLGTQGDNRARVVASLFAISGRATPLGPFGFRANGDPTLDSYGLYKVGQSGNPIWEKTLTPTKLPVGAG